MRNSYRALCTIYRTVGSVDDEAATWISVVGIAMMMMMKMRRTVDVGGSYAGKR